MGWRDKYEQRQRTVSLAHHFIVIAETGEMEHAEVGIWDTAEKAASIARMHFNDTGQMTDVFELVPASSREERS